MRTLFLILLGLEVLLRVLLPTPLPEPYQNNDPVKSERYGWGAPPYGRVMLSNPDTLAPYPEDRRNSRGWKDVERSLTPKKKMRLLVIGGHVTEGMVPLDKLYSRQLENLFRESGRNEAEVFTVGQSYWSTDQILDFVKHEGKNYQPDVIIYEFGQKNWTENIYPNFLFLENRNNIFWRKKTKYVLQDGKLKQISVRDEYPLAPTLAGTEFNLGREIFYYLKQSSTFYYLNRLRRDSIKRPPADAPLPDYRLEIDESFPSAFYPYGARNAYITNGWKLTEALLGELKSTAERQGAKLVVFTTVGDSGRREWERHWGWFQTDSQGDYFVHKGKKLRYQFDRLLSDLRGACKRQRIPLVTAKRTYHRFKNVPEFPTEEGNLNMARDIFDFFMNSPEITKSEPA